MKLKSLFFIVILSINFIFINNISQADGFTANWVDIMILHNGKYRVIIKYTNLKIGEYREAYVDFDSKKEAIEVFQKLALGADFYWGDRKTIHFHDKVEKPKPY
ncbi:hypothetical protein GCL60_09320 [Silvanigrella paludirubra]|jgi:hypothetical protein|uniref:Uncharacterized protein n=1 Tax=Silvanigrella paludirubra TaxID=2499159 RepID=A0A6N6VUZ2_9BACT|nr:hypothetical protein [Silvanigrella paludirubra]KAB8039044.1 hypothetical protein GCL60_09320 [Silvanigrella paludirubra]